MSNNGSGAAPKRHIQKISGYDVIIQSCWVDEGLDIIANVSIGDKGELVHVQQVAIVGDEIKYLAPSFKKIGKQMSHAEFDQFLRGNFQAVTDLIMSLLEPSEVELLRRNDVIQLSLLD